MTKKFNKKGTHTNTPRQIQPPKNTSEKQNIDSNTTNSEKSFENEPVSQYFSKKLYKIYLLVWLYFFIKIFFFDLEALLIDTLELGKYKPFLTLRVFFIPLLIVISGKIWGYKTVTKHIIHFLTVPFYFTIFKFIQSFYQKYLQKIGTNQKPNSTLWVFIFEVLGRLVANYVYYLAQFGLLCFALICLQFAENSYLQISAAICSIILFISIFIKGILQFSSPLKIFGLFKVEDIVSRTNTSTSFWKVQTDNKEKKPQIEIAKEILISYIILNVLQKSVKDIIEKRGFIIFFIADFIFAYFISNIFLTIANASVYNLNHAHFDGKSSFSFFEFYFYTFYGILGEGTNIEPVSTLSKCLKMASSTYGLYLLVFLAGAMWGIFSEKYNQALESILSYLKLQMSEAEPKLSSILGLPIDSIKKSVVSLTQAFQFLANIKIK